MDGIEYFCKSMGKPLCKREILSLFDYSNNKDGILNR